jgi:hypothetical protein
MNKSQLSAYIDFWIKANGQKAITGPIANDVLQKMLMDSVNKETDSALFGLKEYNPATLYLAGMVTVKDGIIYQAKVNTTGAFDINSWRNLSSGGSIWSYEIVGDNVTTVFTMPHEFYNNELFISVKDMNDSNREVYPEKMNDDADIIIEFSIPFPTTQRFKVLVMASKKEALGTFDDSYDDSF